VAEHGDISSWDWKESYSINERNDFVNKYFLPYLNIAKFCPAGESAYACFPNVNYKKLNGNDSGANYGAAITLPNVLLADGSSLRFWFPATNCMESNSRCLSFTIDINGFKKPNTYGRDFFWFDFYPQTNEFLPQGVITTFNSETGKFNKNTYEEILSVCIEGSGASCGARIITEGFKMNY